MTGLALFAAGYILGGFTGIAVVALCAAGGEE